MADLKISELTAAATLTGAELVEAVQGGQNVKTTTQAIADLGSGGGGDVVGPASATDAVPVLFDGITGKLIKNSTPTGSGNPVLATSPTFVTGITTPLIKITSGVPGSGKVLTSDADGDATWETPSGGGGTIASQATVNTGTNDTEIVSPVKLKNRDGAVAVLTDGATVDITSDKNTLATSAATRTFTISHVGDDITMLVTLSATSSLYTFPAAALCVSEGVASGNNTCSLAGVSGDLYLISLKKIGSVYLVACKNWGQ